MKLAITVIPYLDEQLMNDTLATCDRDTTDRILLPVNNVVRNNGVAPAWNRGAEKVIEGRAEWLVLLSTTIRFSPGGERVFLDYLRETPAVLVGAIGEAWHLHAIRRSALQTVGLFDPLFAPAYFEDNDWLHRAELAGVWDFDNKLGAHAWVEVPHESLGGAHSLARGLIPGGIDMGVQLGKYREKWGGNPREEGYATPYNRPDVPVTWCWPEERAARNGPSGGSDDTVLRLDLGSGRWPREGFIAVDLHEPDDDLVDVRAPLWGLPYGDGSVDEIWCSHSLEHVERAMVPVTLGEWYRKLKPGGTVTVEVPDLAWVCKNFAEHADEVVDGDEWLLHSVFGAQTHDGEHHRTGFTMALLQNDLRRAGFEVTDARVVWNHACNTLHVEAVKR